MNSCLRRAHSFIDSFTSVGSPALLLCLLRCLIFYLFFYTAKVNIVEAPDIIRAPFGTSYELQCVATGDPPPLISWLKNGIMVRTRVKHTIYRMANGCNLNLIPNFGF